ncbi:oxidoreductase [Streptomyces viridiviolaceus]
MTTSQDPIGSGFGATSTAQEVLRGLDLSGKLAVVTGGYSGAGLATTRALAEAGAHVVVPARRPAAAAHAVEGIDRAEVDEMDLADLDGVRGFATRFLESGRTIDILINNAGIVADRRRLVGPGWEAHFAVNHLGHYALVNLLWPAIAAGGGRVVALSSVGHRRSGIRWDDLWFEHGYDMWTAYGQSKTASILFALHLDRLGRSRGVRAFSVHPGAVSTPMMAGLPRQELVEHGWGDARGNLNEAVLKTPEQGAATQVWAATSPLLDGMGGVYCEDCDIAERVPDPAATRGVHDHATDPEQAARLWRLSAELTGINAFAADS